MRGAHLGQGQRRPDGEVPGRRRPVTGEVTVAPAPPAPRRAAGRARPAPAPRAACTCAACLAADHCRSGRRAPRAISRYGSRWPSTPIPAALSAPAASCRVSWFPPRSADARTAALRRSVSASRPSCGVPARVTSPDPRRRGREQPADVGRQHEVPGRPQHVGAQDRAGVEGVLHVLVGRAGHTRAQGPLGRPVVLRLDRPEEADGLLGRRAAARRSGAARAAGARRSALPASASNDAHLRAAPAAPASPASPMPQCSIT